MPDLSSQLTGTQLNGNKRNARQISWVLLPAPLTHDFACFLWIAMVPASCGPGPSTVFPWRCKCQATHSYHYVLRGLVSQALQDMSRHVDGTAWLGICISMEILRTDPADSLVFSDNYNKETQQLGNRQQITTNHSRASCVATQLCKLGPDVRH